ncbi:hypothetical protein [Pseudomonas aeruginosa]|uniref:hypothetical protein n=1 Tax=Pseudomonas aeruginosa TaxID=287 RepID=UPI00053EDE6B|nr:hypothetical protein [Pseudomonas aeruginosa]
MLGEAVVRVVDLSQDGFSEQHRRIGAAPTCNESAHAAVGTRLRTGLLSGGGKSLLRKEKRLRVNMEIAREKSKVIIR